MTPGQPAVSAQYYGQLATTGPEIVRWKMNRTTALQASGKPESAWEQLKVTEQNGYLMCTTTMTIHAQNELSAEDSSAIDRTPPGIIFIEVTLYAEDPKIRKMALAKITDQ